MKKSLSKNAQRQGAHELISRWGGTISMRSIFENGRMKHFAECSETKNRARKPRMLM